MTQYCIYSSDDDHSASVVKDSVLHKLNVASSTLDKVDVKPKNKRPTYKYVVYITFDSKLSEDEQLKEVAKIKEEYKNPNFW